ncbi:hypothetical protein C7455_101432 [Roseicyclus mahoneyensis]|uniref:Uncharacterized protein n=2 Tax=Roseicyclus mahoneyensis TaxID=164332 RepID=A0A316GS37_9RHOB|nr:hypothetical protein C7455_101432 [Roseicyclus mahoneyensis]
MAAVTMAMVASAAMTEAEAQTQETRTGGVGNTVGWPVYDRCESGSVIVGFVIRSGTLLDAVQPLCDRVRPDRTGLQGTPVALRMLGGEGGSLQRMHCAAGYAVTQLNVFVDENIRGNGQDLSPAVNHIRMTCARIPTMDDAYEVTHGVSGRHSSNRRVDCPGGQWATGIEVMFGDHRLAGRPAVVDSIGLFCRPLPPRLVAGPGTSIPPAWELSDRPGELSRPIVIRPQGQSETPPAPQAQTRTVLLSTDVYNSPGGNRIGVVQAGTTVTLAEPCRADNWCRIRTGQLPDGWVYSGPDYNSLGI